MGQNDQFNQVCEAWLRAALGILQGIPQLPFYGDIDVTFRSDGLHSTQAGTPKIDADALVTNYHEQIFGLPEYSAAVDMIFNTPELLSALCPDMSGGLPREPERQKAIIGSYFSTFLVAYLTIQQGITFSLSVYECMYQKFEEYIYSTEPIVTATLIHTHNLRSEVDNADIGNQVVLRQATYEEKKEHIKMFSDLHTFPETVLEIRHLVSARKKLDIEQQKEVYDIAHAVVFALRLLKPGFFEEGMYYHDISEQPFRPRQGWGRSLFSNPLSFGHEQYYFKAEDIDAVTQLWPKAKKAYNKPELMIARTRFEGSYLRTSLEDMLIDFWIGLEALFLPPEYTRDMADAVALAVSNYLGRTVKSRTTIYKDVIASHKLRGKVIHGKPMDAGNLKELTDKTGNLLRRSLRVRIEE